MPDQLDMAALLYAGDASVITGLAALRRYMFRAPAGTWTGQGKVPSQRVDVLVPSGRRRTTRDFVVLHRTGRMPPRVGFDGQIQFALPARAVADAARILSAPGDVRALVAAAVQQRICTVPQLTQELFAGQAQHSGGLRAILSEVSDGVRSVPEGDLRHLIAAAGLPAPLFNARLYLGGSLLAVPDAWWPAAALAVEVDSHEWHLAPEPWERTMSRHARLTAVGVLVQHFSPRQIRNGPGEVVSAIRAALRVGRPVPGITARPAA